MGKRNCKSLFDFAVTGFPAMERGHTFEIERVMRGCPKKLPISGCTASWSNHVLQSRFVTRNRAPACKSNIPKQAGSAKCNGAGGRAAAKLTRVLSDDSLFASGFAYRKNRSYPPARSGQP